MRDRRRPALNAAILASACAATDPSPVPIAARDQTAYTAACEAVLGRLPPLSCADATPVPVFLTDDDGTREVQSVAELEDGFRCDDPSGLSGCVPGSRARVDTTDAGVPFTFVCRKYAEHPGEPDRYDQLGIVAHDPATGATCFWSTPDDGLARTDPIPVPGSADDVEWQGGRPFWYTLDELSANPCVACHDNDPWVRTPWIAQMDPPSDPLGPYEIVWGDTLGWTLPARIVHPDAAPCLACHRLAAGRSCELASDAAGRKGWQMPVSSAFEAWPLSHWMDDYDPDVLVARYPTEEAWDSAFGAAVDAVESCCGGSPDPACWE